MKNIIQRFSITACTVAILLSGCSKNFINKSPNDSVPASQALNTQSGLADALNGAYSGLRAVSLYGRDFPIIGDLQADNTYVETKNAGRYLPQYNYSVVSSDVVEGEMWNQAYIDILRVNNIIDANVTGPNVAAIKAQAYAIRGLLYFKLVNIYGKPYTVDSTSLGVPIILHFNPNLFPARNKVSEVYSQIVSDFKMAMAAAPAYSSSVRISKYAAEALLARTYLYMGDNTDAKTAAVDVINNSPFTLVTASSYGAYWQNPAARTDAVETMFEVDCDAINNNGFDDLGAMYYNGYNDIYCSSQLYNLYSATDVRKSLLMPHNTKSGSPAYMVLKFPNAQNTDRDNLKVIRLSEVYLIAAEASLPNNEPDALKYLNALLAQRDPLAAPYVLTGPLLLQAIVTERRKELAFEGDRLYDMNRLQLPIARASNPGAIPAGPSNINLNIPYPDNRRVAPIPQQEMTANPNIVQNPGY
ncbi:MAG: RagB/SusD family nutrient uptake outer membrane protein [Hydrotalea flava]|uniref:RagB/SusD family nutrient uptake outer membrane protein n=1 Tax=Hydrotalea TaxID=1004300 RepID=UPI000942D880|nr:MULTISPECIES: RagB/SusD family nutrient uptake outer membrane protein [Hydrotalea]MBY0347237.1 RagB/SusD family nutrient uptake outer membrane protein [Hydrotalea flava]NIM36379.1 RagB/SusD family nutrient uptake outer membrane protein [Hydrotalea flava]NIM39237.1 RagB/SusD family nutrient uptake outer membrane protein [Hydrotalea flava]NIN04473.1 RagB/SusD family nutrient uptake outer membrane protein [Hydrotalea flava]NIN16098.1 RagB/SusD family nutrient uptake outer membrane protein [Hyd